MTNENLIKKARELKELKAMADELEGEIKAIENEIKAEMTDRNETELKVDVYKISYKDVNSTKFDTKGFKEIYNDLYKEYSKPYTYKRFSVA